MHEGRAYFIATGITVFSVWIGMQIDNRDPLAWMFLLAIPAAVIGVVVLLRRRKLLVRRPASAGHAEQPDKT